MLNGLFKYIIYIAISGMISNLLGYLIPREIINYDAFPYKSFKWENGGNIYNCFRVTKWKKKLPDMSRVLKTLYPKTVGYKPDSMQLDRLLRETCVAEFIHTMLIVVSPLVYRIIGGSLGNFFVVCNVLGNLPYIVIQRYNRPKLRRVYAALLKKEKQSRLSEEIANESIDFIV